MSELLDQIVTTGYRIRNPYKIVGDCVIVYCYKIKDDTINEVLLDYDFWLDNKELYYSVSQSNGAVHVTYEKERVMIHRLVMNIHDVGWQNGELIVDHINRNNYDNRKDNLRIVSCKINNRNHGFFNERNKSTGIYGIDIRDGKYRVRVSYLNEVGTEETFFDDLKEACIYNYKRRLEEGFLFSEGSTTIENYINDL